MSTLKKNFNEKAIGYVAFAVGIAVAYVLSLLFLPNKVIVSPIVLLGIIVMSNLAPSFIKPNPSDENIFSLNLLARITASLIFSFFLVFAHYFFQQIN